MIAKSKNLYIIWSVFSLFILSMNLRASITSISPVLKNIQADLQMSSVVVSLLTALPVFVWGFCTTGWKVKCTVGH